MLSTTGQTVKNSLPLALMGILLGFCEIETKLQEDQDAVAASLINTLVNDLSIDSDDEDSPRRKSRSRSKRRRRRRSRTRSRSRRRKSRSRSSRRKERKDKEDAAGVAAASTA